MLGPIQAFTPARQILLRFFSLFLVKSNIFHHLFLFLHVDDFSKFYKKVKIKLFP